MVSEVIFLIDRKGFHKGTIFLMATVLKATVEGFKNSRGREIIHIKPRSSEEFTEEELSYINDKTRQQGLNVFFLDEKVKKL